MNNKTLRVLTKKHNAYKRLIQAKCGQDYEKYRKHSNAAKSTSTVHRSAVEKNITENSKVNNKKVLEIRKFKIENKVKGSGFEI